MNKDIIYIDVDDDITAIIGKIKASKDKIVAIVPPKRTGVLQSAVNLRLLARTAERSHKHLVLITNNQALIALSAVAKIPIAKNLQSKPELAEIAALEIDEDEDVIDGAQLPVGELVKSSHIKPDLKKIKGSDELTEDEEVSEVIEDIDVESDISVDDLPDKKSKGMKVPDFSKFRKRLFITIFLSPFVIGFFVWAIWFAPAAKIIVTAKTSSAPVSKQLIVGGTAATDLTKGTIQTITKTIKKDLSVDFTATGKKDLGVKSSGSITIRNCDYSSGFTLPAGTQFTNSSSKVFVSLTSVSVPGFNGSSSGCNLSGNSSGKATVKVEALETGEAYDNAGVSYDIDTIPTSAKVDAIGTAMTGGTSRMATVVSADDIKKATQILADLSTTTFKDQLTSQFANGEKIIADSFTVDSAAAVSTPLLDAEAADGKAKLVSSSIFTMTAITKSELEVFLKDEIGKQITNANTQRIYDDGIDGVKVKDFHKFDTYSTVNIEANGQIGPKIDQAFIKEQVKGMKFGDIQALLSNINGISNVDVKFSYFWVTTVPGDKNKIDVQFVLQNE